MTRVGIAATVVLLAGCGLAVGPPTVIPPPSVGDARVLLTEIIDAGIAHDFERLCASGSGTCERELEGVEHLAPDLRPTVVRVTVVEPTGTPKGWASGGVHFVLCGLDAAGRPYESEVLVFDDGSRLLATGAVFWTGTKIGFAPPAGADGVTVVAEPSDVPTRCP